jgi:hypothetical protein
MKSDILQVVRYISRGEDKVVERSIDDLRWVIQNRLLQMGFRCRTTG